ncbi:unnamed protein product [Thelazia callipaeda]|uniref:Major sperm protein n=1 Tax=Thelazia callipaeda TaxID=103827 RepID=A0A0N5CXN7_THECL|nr:unnamed protein product [Thelazia callipaeda]
MVLNEAGINEPYNRLEFPEMPKSYKGFQVQPSVISFKSGQSIMTMHNTGEFPVLYKVKCTSNHRISILDCAGILLPKHETVVLVHRHNSKKKKPMLDKDFFLILYTLVGPQWCNNDANAFLCWRRVKVQQIPVKSILIPTKELNKVKLLAKALNFKEIIMEKLENQKNHKTVNICGTVKTLLYTAPERLENLKRRKQYFRQDEPK